MRVNKSVIFWHFGGNRLTGIHDDFYDIDFYGWGAFTWAMQWEVLRPTGNYCYPHGRMTRDELSYSADKISIGYIKSALFKYRQNGNRAGTEIDTYELDRVLRDNTEVERDPGYKAWIEKTFGKVIKNEGIPNGKDPYTSSGNRRSFKQTHVPATLENIVAQMQKDWENSI